MRRDPEGDAMVAWAQNGDPIPPSNVDVTPQGRHPGQSNGAIEKGVDRPDHTLRR